MAREIEPLKIVQALGGSTEIATAEPLPEITAAIAAGTIVILKDAFDPVELRRARAAIIAAETPYSAGDMYKCATSVRARMKDPPETKVKQSFENYLIAVNNRDDALGASVHSPFDRLATYWRSLTGGTYTFVPAADGKAIRPWAMYYPAGGGHLDWHTHKVEPSRVGVILALSEIGVDFQSGATDFKTPSGVVSTMARHDIGDVCLFRYDLPHRVTPVDPDRQLRWDGVGRWTFIIPVQ